VGLVHAAEQHRLLSVYVLQAEGAGQLHLLPVAALVWGLPDSSVGAFVLHGQKRKSRRVLDLALFRQDILLYGLSADREIFRPELRLERPARRNFQFLGS
jgi:hypothetical protein